MRIEEGRISVPILDRDLLRSLPFFLSGIALNWFRGSRHRWATLKEFAAACRIRFGDMDFQFELPKEIHRRLHLVIHRADVVDFVHLELLATPAEKSYRVRSTRVTDRLAGRTTNLATNQVIDRLVTPFAQGKPLHKLPSLESVLSSVGTETRRATDIRVRRILRGLLAQDVRETRLGTATGADTVPAISAKSGMVRETPECKKNLRKDTADAEKRSPSIPPPRDGILTPTNSCCDPSEHFANPKESLPLAGDSTSEAVPKGDPLLAIFRLSEIPYAPTVISGPEPLLLITLDVLGRPVKALVDTGASRTFTGPVGVRLAQELDRLTHASWIPSLSR